MLPQKSSPENFLLPALEIIKITVMKAECSSTLEGVVMVVTSSWPQDKARRRDATQTLSSKHETSSELQERNHRSVELPSV